jgi:sugar phosphate permease
VQIQKSGLLVLDIGGRSINTWEQRQKGNRSEPLDPGFDVAPALQNWPRENPGFDQLSIKRPAQRIKQEGMAVTTVLSPGANRPLTSAGGPRSRVRWFVLFLISLMYLITYMDRANISVTATAISSEFHLSKTEMGLIFSAFAWAYAIGQIPGGWLGDRFGPKSVLLLIVPFWSVMTAATAWASGLVSLFTIRFVFGLGEAGAFPTATRAMQLWFPKEERGLIQGVTHCFSRIAVAVTPFATVLVMTAFGWRWVFFSFAALGIVWAAAFAVLYRNRPQDHPGVNAAELAHIRGGPDTAAIHATERQPVPWKRIFSSPNMWYIAAGYFCFFYGSFFYLTWFPTYLLEYRHLSLKAVGVFAAAPLVTAMIGDIVGGTLTDRVYRRTGRLSFSRRVVAAPALLGAAVFLVPAAMTADATTAIICLAASNFFLDMVLGPAWAVPMDVGGASSGTVTGVMNMSGAVGASISPLVFGTLVQQGSWIAPFFVTAAVLVAGAFIWIFLINPEKSVVAEPQ